MSNEKEVQSVLTGGLTDESSRPDPITLGDLERTIFDVEGVSVVFRAPKDTPVQVPYAYSTSAELDETFDKAEVPGELQRRLNEVKIRNLLPDFEVSYGALLDQMVVPEPSLYAVEEVHRELVRDGHNPMIPFLNFNSPKTRGPYRNHQNVDDVLRKTLSRLSRGGATSHLMVEMPDPKTVTMIREGNPAIFSKLFQVAADRSVAIATDIKFEGGVLMGRLRFLETVLGNVAKQAPYHIGIVGVSNSNGVLINIVKLLLLPDTEPLGAFSLQVA